MVLVRHFLDTERAIGVHSEVSKSFVAAVRQYDWPGNVRELRNVIERMRLTHSDQLSYSKQDLDPRLQDPLPQSENGTPHPTLPPQTAPPPRRVELPQPTDIHAFLKSGTSPLRRADHLRSLFEQHHHLTRSEIVQLLHIAPNTATKYLKALCNEGFIRRIEPSASTRTHYFERVDSV